MSETSPNTADVNGRVAQTAHMVTATGAQMPLIRDGSAARVQASANRQKSRMPPTPRSDKANPTSKTL
jgi:hypothetical protein